MTDLPPVEDDLVENFLKQLHVDLPKPKLNGDSIQDFEFADEFEVDVGLEIDLFEQIGVPEDLYPDPFYDMLFDDLFGAQKAPAYSGNYLYASEMFQEDLFDDSLLEWVVFEDDEDGYHESRLRRIWWRIQDLYDGVRSRFQSTQLDRRLDELDEEGSRDIEADEDRSYVQEIMRVAGSKVLTRGLMQMFQIIPATPATRKEIDRLLDIATSVEKSSFEQQIAVQELVDLLENSTEVGIRKWRGTILETIRAELQGYGPLEPLLHDNSITDIMVNGPKNIFVERRGLITRTSVVFDDDPHLLRIIDRILAPFARRVDEQHPTARVRLPDGSRVEIITRPASLIGPTIAIRKFSRYPIGIQDLIRFGSLTPETAEFLRACTIARLNVLIIGGNGSGKNTFANVLSSFIPNDERIITIEYVAEYQLQQEHVVPLEVIPPNDNGDGGMSFTDLIDVAVNLRPDRLVFGELRGAEAFNVLEALQRGMDGSIMLLHATGPSDALNRLETMCYMNSSDVPVRGVQEMIVRAVDVIVEIQRLRDGSRKVIRVAEVTGFRDNRILVENVFEFEQTGIEAGKILGRIRPTGKRPTFMNRIEDAGIHLPPTIFGIGGTQFSVNKRSMRQRSTQKIEKWDAEFVPQGGWRFNTEDEIRATSVINNEQIFFGSYDTNLYVVDLITGSLVWRHPTEGGVVTTPTFHRDLVIFGSEDYTLYALNRRTGRIEWSYITRDRIRSSATVMHDHVFFGSDDGNLYALTANNGRLMWSYDSGAPIRCCPVVTNDRIIFGNDSGEIMGLDLGGLRKWTFKTKGAIYSSPCYDPYENMCYVGSDDGFIYGLDASNGYSIWRFRVGKPIVSSPVLYQAAKMLYFGATDGSLFALEAESGRQVWWFQTQKPIVAPPVVHNNRVYFGGTDGYLYCVDAGTGKELWKFRTGGAITGAPAVTDTHVVVGALDHKLYVLPLTWFDGQS